MATASYIKVISILGGGSILAGVVLGAMTVFIVDRRFVKAGWFAIAGAALTFFGLMHGEEIGIGQTPFVAVAYVMVAGILFGCDFYKAAPPPVVESEHETEEEHHEESAVEAAT